MKKFLLSITFLSVFILNAFSFDLTLRLTPSLFIPQTPYRQLSMAGYVQADADILGFLTTGIEGSFAMSTPYAESKQPDGTVKIVTFDPITYAGIGIGAGAYYYPLSRLYVSAGGSFGLYQFFMNQDSARNLYWRGYGEVGFRFNPSFTLGASVGYQDYMILGGASNLKGLSAGISARYSVPLGKKSSTNISLNLEQDDGVYPIYMDLYKTAPAATLVLKNNSSAELKNVKVSFRAAKYTASAMESANVSRINKYQTVEVPLLVDFSSEILKFSENGKISGEVIVDYDFLGKKMQAVQNVTLSLYNRNAFTWSDTVALSAFVSPDTAEILEFAKIVAGASNMNFVSGMNQNLQTAMAMMEGIKLAGVTYSDDKRTPYVTAHLSDELDSVQYPLQTLSYLSGDYDDIGLLLINCLEAVGIQTAYIPLEDDFIVLVNMAIKPGTGKNHVADENTLIDDGQDVYIGLSMKYFEQGFTVSKQEASKRILQINAGELEDVEMVCTEEAWATYPAVSFTGIGSATSKPDENELLKLVSQRIEEYKKSDLDILVEQAKKSGNANKLGIVYVRSGRYSEAKAQFQKLNTTSALNNLAAIYLYEKNYDQALATYKKVLDKDPENAIAKNGIEQINFKLGL